MFSFRSVYLQPAVLALAGALLLPGSPARAVELYQGEARFARVQKLEGAVTIGHAYQVANEFAVLQPNDPIGEGDKVNLESGAMLLLRFTDGSRLLAQGPAQFELYRLNARKPYEIRLYSGTALIDNRADRALYLDTSDGALTINSRSRALLQGGKNGVAVSALGGELVAGDEDHPVRLRSGDGLRLNREQPGAVESAPRDAGAGLLRWADGNGTERDENARDDEDARDDGARDNGAQDERAERDDEADNEDSGDIRRRHINLPPDIAVYRGELNRNGRWKFISGYGWTWRPYRVAAGWMPYSAGFWRHTPWGIFWVSHEPWGWAPYHYGNWRYNPVNGWFWIPGSSFSGAWVVFDYADDWWSWSPGYYSGGYWYASHHRFLRCHYNNFYNYHPPVVYVNHPHYDPRPGTPRGTPPIFLDNRKGGPRGGGSVDPRPTPPIFQDDRKGRPRDGGPSNPRPTPPIFQDEDRGKPRGGGSSNPRPTPPIFQDEERGKPRGGGSSNPRPTPPIFQDEDRGKPRGGGSSDPRPTPPIFQDERKGRTRDIDPPEQNPTPPIHTNKGRPEPEPPQRGDDGGGHQGGGSGGKGGHTETPPARPPETQQGGRDHSQPAPAHSPKHDKDDPRR